MHLCLARAVPPLAANDQYTLTVGGNTVVTPAGVLANDRVPCGAAATINVVAPGPAQGYLTLDSFGGFTYTPNSPAAPAADSFKYTVTCNGLVSGKYMSGVWHHWCSTSLVSIFESLYLVEDSGLLSHTCVVHCNAVAQP